MFGIFRKKQSPVTPVLGIPSQSFDEVRSRIVPIIKVIEHCLPDGIELELPPEDSPIAKPLAADLLIFYAEDLPETFAYVSRRRMEQLGLTLTTLHELAVSNLPNRIPPIDVHGEAPKRMVTCGGNFEAALLLHDALWDHAALNTSGEIMAIVPARDLLIFSDSAWEGAISFLSEHANKEREEKRHLLSRCILVRRNGTWVTGPTHS